MLRKNIKEIYNGVKDKQQISTLLIEVRRVFLPDNGLTFSEAEKIIEEVIDTYSDGVNGNIPDS